MAMALADFPEDVYCASLPVLAEKILATDEIEAPVVMVAQRGEVLQRLVQDEEERFVWVAIFANDSSLHILS